MASEKGGIWALISGSEPPPPLPGLQQSGESIQRWIRSSIRTDLAVIVRHEQRNMVEFSLDRVVNINFHLERLTLENHGTFRFDGTGSAGRNSALTMMAPEPDVTRAALTGQAWINGQPAYRRPLPQAELALAQQLTQAESDVSAVA